MIMAWPTSQLQLRKHRFLSLNKYFSYHSTIIMNFCICFKDDEDGHLVVLIIIEELMSKTKDEFLDHFARLGIFSKVYSLIGNKSDNEIASDVIKSPSTDAAGSSTNTSSASSSVLRGKTMS